MRFSEASVEQRYGVLLDAGSSRLLEAGGSLAVAEGTCGGSPLRIAVTDRSRSGGSLGVPECEMLARNLMRSAAERVPVVLVLDSAGARLDAGLPALGAFRRLYRAALDARVSGLPMIAVVVRDCFGGASMLAMLCSSRAATDASRIGMSGPSIVEALSGRQELDSADAAAVSALFGVDARARLGVIDRLCVDDPGAVSDAVHSLLAEVRTSPPDLETQHSVLKERLVAAGMLPVDQHPDPADAFRRGRAVGAADIWLLTDMLLASRAEKRMTIVLDCPGQAPTRYDEAVVLSEYVAHLALCLQYIRESGCEVSIRISGEAGGGIYVAFAAAATYVDALPGAVVRLLPPQAVMRVLRNPLPDASLDEALAAGVIDQLLPA